MAKVRLRGCLANSDGDGRNTRGEKEELLHDALLFLSDTCPISCPSHTKNTRRAQLLHPFDLAAPAADDGTSGDARIWQPSDCGAECGVIALGETRQRP